MKLFAYYAWHNLINQLRKLFKTWVLIFILACIVIGGLVGLGAALLSDAAGDKEAPKEIAGEILEEQVAEGLPEEEEGGLSKVVDANGLVELIAGGVILGLLLLFAFRADQSGSKIFLPADVALLFPSPMQPQSVLMFRLACQLGVALVSSIYLCFQIPNLVYNAGLGGWAVAGLLLTWFFSIAMGKLLQVLLYTLSATRPGWKRWLRKSCYLLLALLVAAWLIYSRLGGKGGLAAAVGLFNHPITRYIPIWGWLKGICAFCLLGELRAALLCFVALLLGGALLALLIWRIRADFYEDAMQKSEQTAELQELARAEKTVGFRKRKKDRSETLRRDGLSRGQGAPMFFRRSLYNRFRFAHFGFFTKTGETYLVLSLGLAVLCRFVWRTESPLPLVFSLGGMSFFRAMGNPLEEDTSKDFFRLIPEPALAKLFYSLLGGTMNCLLDLLPAMLLGGIALRGNPLPLLLWLPLILSIDFFASAVGSFIALSVPVNAGKVVKQLAQIMFLYFGLLPDAGILALGVVFSRVWLSVIGATLLNLLIGGLFLLLTPLFLEPKDQPIRAEASRKPEEQRLARRAFSRMGLSCFVMLLAASAAQILLAQLFPRWISDPVGMWVCTFAPLYLVGLPLALLLLRKVPRQSPVKQKLGGKRLLILIPICVFFLYAGNLLGNLLNTLLNLLLGQQQEAAILNYAMSESLPLKTLFMVILAPILEEYIFRKRLIDGMRPYGEKLAVLLSAAMFGLFHGNLSQMFYAFGLGLAFGYVYLRTGRLRWSVGLHMGINALGGLLAPALLEKMGPSVSEGEITGLAALQSLLTPELMLLLGYVLLLLLLSLLGLVLLCTQSRKLRFEPTGQELPRRDRLRVACGNPGMLLLLLGCLALVVAPYLLR